MKIERKCLICDSLFYIDKYKLKHNRGKVCSMTCKYKLNGIQKTKGTWRKCKKCGSKFWHKLSEDRRGYKHIFCSRKCYRPTERGKAISVDGYYVICGKKVHRSLMEDTLKRKLFPTEIVHHINGNKLDNRIENLQLVTRSEHNKIHRFLTKKPSN